MRLDKIVKIIRYIAGVPKSIYVNFRVLPLHQAVFLPIMVSRKTKLQTLSGKVYLEKIKTGIVRIGFGGTDMLDYRYNRPLLKLTGNIYFKGKAKIGIGAKIDVSGKLFIGSNVNITGDATIICAKKISIGNDTMIAWQSIIMDTDQHEIYNEKKECINLNQEIQIGNNVWIGARCFILKNTVIEDGCIIGANTTLTKSFKSQNSIIAGNPPKVIKESISWKH